MEKDLSQPHVHEHIASHTTGTTTVSESALNDLLYLASKHYSEMAPHVQKRKTGKLLKDLIKQNKGFRHNLEVIDNELIQVKEVDCSASAWDRINLALEFSEI